MRLSCYAKALTCSEDDTFVTKVRLKFATLIAADHPGEARAEVERVIEHRRREGNRTSAEANHMAQSEWFLAASTATSGRTFYDRFKLRAEELLFAHLPWTDASVGDEFVIKGQDGQKDRTRRRIYVRSSPLALEISVPATHPDVRRLELGAPIRVQIEASPGEPWKTTVHRIQPRSEGAPHDVVEEVYGVIDHVNQTRSLLHFIVAKDVDGTVPLAQFSGSAEVGQTIALRLARYHDRKGARTRSLSISPTSRPPAPGLLKSFSEQVEVRNGLGFTAGGIFIPPDVVAAGGIVDGDAVNGIAVINFDKKRNTWGWKAIRAADSHSS